MPKSFIIGFKELAPIDQGVDKIYYLLENTAQSKQQLASFSSMPATSEPAFVIPKVIQDALEKDFIKQDMAFTDASPTIPDSFALDAEFFPLLRTLAALQSNGAKNKILHDEFSEQFSQIQTLLSATLKIKTHNLDVIVTKKAFSDLQESISILDVHELTNIVTLNENIATVAADTLDTYQRFMHNSKHSKLRDDLIHALQLCAFAYAQQAFSNSTSQAFIDTYNEQFTSVARLQRVDELPVLKLDDACKKLNFTQLQQLVVVMLEKFNKFGTSLFWTDTAQKTLFIKCIANLTDHWTYELTINNFRWYWHELSQHDNALYKKLYDLDAIVLNRITFMTDVQTRVTAMLQVVTAAKIQAEQSQAQLDHDHAYLSNTVTEITRTVKEMLDDYLFVQDMMNVHNIIPCETLANSILRAQELKTLIHVRQSVAATSSNAEKAATAVKEVASLYNELQQIVTPFNQTIANLTILHYSKSPAEIAEDPLHNTLNSHDKLIMATRKFANMLGDVKYFSAKVSWGGVSLTQNGVTYSVPTSYQELFYLKNSVLSEPITYDNATAFWQMAKDIETRAQQRGSYRFYFFRVRSEAMSSLLNLINGINVNSTTLVKDMDSKLSRIKSNWQEDQDKRTIAMKPEDDLNVAVERHLVNNPK